MENIKVLICEEGFHKSPNKQANRHDFAARIKALR